jgi:IS5 family transposase
MAVDITALYCCLDDFCKVFADWEAHRLIPSEQTRRRPGKLSRAEMLLIVVLFHLSPYKNFKTFYRYGVGHQHRACFGELPHYDRFVSLMPRLFAPLMVLLHSLSGEPTGVYFADSTKLAVCHNRRIHRHRVFDGLAARGKTSMGEAAGGSIGPADRWRGSGGWFFGLKLHFVVNHRGQVVALRITPGNTADSTVLDEVTRHLAGKLYADKGYIGHELFERLWRRGLHLITRIRRNMRNHLMPLADKLMLRKRFLIETVLDTLKSEMGLEHSRHRSVINAMVHVLSCLVAYAFRPGKPSISLTRQHIEAYP